MQTGNNIDTTGFVLKTKYDTDKSDLKKRISNIRELAKKTDYNTLITEIESKTPSTNGLATTAALTAVENKTPDVSNLVTKTDYDTKISDIESKYVTTADYNKFTKDILTNKIKSEGLIDKFDIAEFINSADIDKNRIKIRARQNNKVTSVLFKLSSS